MISKKIIFFFSLFLSGYLFAQKEVLLISPNGNIVFTLKTNEDVPVYSVSFKKNILIGTSVLNLDIEGMGMLQKAFVSKPPVFNEVNEIYKLIVGKASTVNNHYKQAIISIKDKANENYQFDLEVRVFNDGVAFRYSWPKQKEHSSFTLLEEQTQFRFTADPIVKALLLPNFTTSHEGLYTTTLLSKIKEDTLM